MSSTTPKSKSSKIVVIGGGPAGLTSAAELVESGHQVEVLEMDETYVGGIARTVENEGFRFDIGGHRFFSKSDEVTQWWYDRLPDDFISVRRMSRIFYQGTFFDYPLKPMNALFGLGFFTSFLCGLSYLKARVFPIRPEKSFADWVSNRFGKKLFLIFFKTYTEKVWGMSCDDISADWAAQRIKGLSLFSAVWNAIMPKRKGGEVVKTLIDTFQYPRLGPGMMWEKTRDDIREAGSSVTMGREVFKIQHEGSKVTGVVSRDSATGANEETHTGEHFICSMPLREAVLAFDPPLPEPALKAAKELTYRDFLTVALMVRKKDLFPDNWIYVHDPSVKLGRIQNFNNWSPELVPDEEMTCLGLEYFCFEGDGLWNMADEDLIELGKKEVHQLELVDAADIERGVVVRMPKSYPIYGPGYKDAVDTIREHLAPFTNIQPVGRNGMHKYNNQDHSMMTALLAARNINGSEYDIWRVNTDAEYHEEGEVDDNAGRLTPKKVES